MTTQQDEDVMWRSTAITAPYDADAPFATTRQTAASSSLSAARPSDAVMAARQRVEAYEASLRGSLAEQQKTLQAAAFCNAMDIVDDYYESCRTVILFELWKLQRSVVWDHWLDQLGRHVVAYRLIEDRQAFAGSVYIDAGQETRSVWIKDQVRRKDFLRGRRVATDVYVRGLQKHPLYLSDDRPLPQQQQVSRSHSVGESKKMHGRKTLALGGEVDAARQNNVSSPSTSATRESRARRAAALHHPLSSTFVRGVLQRIADVAAGGTPSSTATATPSTPSHLANLLTPLGTTLGVRSQPQPFHQTRPLLNESSTVDDFAHLSTPPPAAALAVSPPRPPSSNLRTPAVTFSAE